MLDIDALAALAGKCGFTHCAPLNVTTLEFLPEIRDMCSADKCRNYGKTWSCPPACPSLDDIRRRAGKYGGGLLVQTVGDLEDSYDWDGIQETEARHKANFKQLRSELEKEFDDLLALGSGPCNICKKCSYPDEPCRHPGKIEVSMEASGLFVSKVCTDNRLGYNYGPDKISFTACFLF